MPYSKDLRMKVLISPLSLYFALSFSVIIIVFKFCTCLLYFLQMSLTLIVHVSEKKIYICIF